MKVIDLRSDTVTLPSADMREAMASAELGDDVFGEDPSVNQLQEMAAKMLGKEAALLTPSGTQSNLIATLVHCPRGTEAIVGDKAHMLYYEVGGAWGVGGVGLRTVPNDARGRLEPADVEGRIRPDNEHFPRTAMIAVENTHNLCGGSVLGEEELAPLRAVADEHGVPLHMDGARLFNAAVKLSVPVSRLAGYADSVCFSLSKGLGCPVGSVLCGSREFIHEAHRYRKMLGGGMRQAGVLAAAGVYALQNMVHRLAEDHDNARIAGEGLAGIPGVSLDPAPETNMVYFQVEGWQATALARRLTEEGALCFDEPGGRVRWVTHYGIERADVEEAVEVARSVIGSNT
jgi:threonine aldolase